MGRKTNIGSILLAATSFIGGVAAGLLLAPQKGSQNRAWISDHVTELGSWVDNKRRDARNKGSKELRKFRKNVQQGIRQNVPDLYKATEEIDLSRNDVISE